LPDAELKRPSANTVPLLRPMQQLSEPHQGLVGLVPWLQQHKDNPTQILPAESSETD